MIKSKYSLRKIIMLILSVDFYYLLSIVIGKYLNILEFKLTIKNVLLSFFPTILNKYWFVTAYLLIYILSPYINKFIKSLSKNQFKKLLVISLFIWGGIPTFFGIFYNTTEKILYYNRFIWLLIMYFVGAYLRLYSINMFKKNKYMIVTAITSFVMMLTSILVINKFTNLFEKIGTTELAYFWTPNNVLMFLLSISIFGLFKNININSNKIINALASTTLGIYMLHDGLLNKYIWKNIFNASIRLESKYSILYILGSSIIIFLVGFIIDFIRKIIEKYTIKKLLCSNKYNAFEKNISKKVNNIMKKI
jgi:surface polysaccharide O-acyltransferase-like enzyme